MICVIVMVWIKLKVLILLLLVSGVFFIFISMLIGMFFGGVGRFVSCSNNLVWFFIVLFKFIMLLE